MFGILCFLQRNKITKATERCTEVAQTHSAWSMHTSAFFVTATHSYRSYLLFWGISIWRRNSSTDSVASLYDLSPLRVECGAIMVNPSSVLKIVQSTSHQAKLVMEAFHLQIGCVEALLEIGERQDGDGGTRRDRNIPSGILT